MIKLSLFVIFVILIYNQALSEVELSAPYIQRTSVRDPPQITVTWTAIESGDEDEPVLGYKKLRLQKAHFTNSTHTVGADRTEYTQENVKINITYEVKVQAFTKNSEGPLSSPSRVTLH